MQFIVLFVGDLEFFTFDNYRKQFIVFDKDELNDDKPKSEKSFEDSYSAFSAIKHITFILTFLFMSFIIFIKLIEWVRAIQIITKENKLDEEIVKIHLYD